MELRKREVSVVSQDIQIETSDEGPSDSADNITSSATNLVSVRNNRVFPTALTALTEPPTPWQRIRRDPSPKRRVALHTSLAGTIIPCLLFSFRCILRSPPRRQASFTLRPECGDVYAPSERHVCYTLRSTYVVAIYPTPSAVYAFHRPSATF